MPRSKVFDPDEKVDQAVELFWRRGFEATSVQELVEHLGISRGSLYDTFGSKEGLWQQALRRYCIREGEETLALLAAPGPLLPRIRTLLERLADAPRIVPDQRGCLIVNAAMERVPVDPDTTRAVVTQFARVEEALYAAVRRAQDDREIDANRDARSLARFLLSTIQGLHVLGKATGDAAALRDVVDVCLDALGPRAQGIAV